MPAAKTESTLARRDTLGSKISVATCTSRATTESNRPTYDAASPPAFGVMGSKPLDDRAFAYVDDVIIQRLQASRRAVRHEGRCAGEEQRREQAMHHCSVATVSG